MSAHSDNTPLIDGGKMHLVLQEIRAERFRQVALLRAGKITGNCADATVPLEKRFMTLVEKFAEAAVEANRIIHDGRDARNELRMELIQTAAVATALAESLTD